MATDDYSVLTNFDNCEIECDKENEFLYKFSGTLTIEGSEPLPLDEGQILLRGSSLRNTEWIYGVAVYTGHDSKVMMNSSRSRPKLSKLEKATNKYILLGIIIQSVICIFSACYGNIWLLYMKSKLGDYAQDFYIDLDVTGFNGRLIRDEEWYDVVLQIVISFV